MKIIIFFRKLFSFLSLLALIASIFLFFHVGFKISQTRNTAGLPGLEGIAYFVPFGLILLSLVFLIITFIFYLLTKKEEKWSFKNFLGVWVLLLFISLTSFGLSLLTIAQVNNTHFAFPRS